MTVSVRFSGLISIWYGDRQDPPLLRELCLDVEGHDSSLPIPKCCYIKNFEIELYIYI
jgi:hypothetical protein